MCFLSRYFILERESNIGMILLKHATPIFRNSRLLLDVMIVKLRGGGVIPSIVKFLFPQSVKGQQLTVRLHCILLHSNG